MGAVTGSNTTKRPSREKQICSYCNGTGFTISTTSTPFGTPSLVNCPLCNNIAAARDSKQQ